MLFSRFNCRNVFRTRFSRDEDKQGSHSPRTGPVEFPLRFAQSSVNRRKSPDATADSTCADVFRWRAAASRRGVRGGNRRAGGGDTRTLPRTVEHGEKRQLKCACAKSARRAAKAIRFLVSSAFSAELHACRVSRPCFCFCHRDCFAKPRRDETVALARCSDDIHGETRRKEQPSDD